MSTESLWLGALTSTSVRAVAKLNLSTTSAVLACRDSAGNWVRGTGVATVGNIAKLECTGLTPNTAYTCRVEPDTKPAVGLTGSFTTLPSGTNVSFLVALCGDAEEFSNATVFDAVRTSGARFGIHLGDRHYGDEQVVVADQAHHRAAYDSVLAQPRQSDLHRSLPLAYRWDDHDYCGNNSDGTSAAHDAACAVYRARVPHYDLADATITAHVGQSWVVGRVRFIMTDERSAASPRANTDNSSKTMLGTSQKTWWKAEVSAAAAAGQMIVWVTSRHWCANTTAGADHWGGFNTERVELVNYIKANAHGRAIILSADMHAMMIRSPDFATGGGEAIPCFNVATLDHGTIDASGYGGVGASGSTQFVAQNGIFGTMQITDSGGSTISVGWRGFDSSGTGLFATHSFSVTV
jgi:phosphodiesterase/alkaline phosphatase D-like protein